MDFFTGRRILLINCYDFSGQEGWELLTIFMKCGILIKTYMLKSVNLTDPKEKKRGLNHV